MPRYRRLLFTDRSNRTVPARAMLQPTHDSDK